MNKNKKKRIKTHTVGSSETLRKTPVNNFFENDSIFTKPFDFTHLHKHQPQHISAYAPEFLAWFLGFSEGDGSFIGSGDRLFFTITQKDKATLLRLRTQLGFGSVCNDYQFPEIHRLTVTHRDQIKILITLFNGNLLLKKTNQRFAHWLDHYNQLTGENIQLKSRWQNLSSWSGDFSQSRERCHPEILANLQKNSVIWNTAWFSGFLEAEGCFSAMIRRQGYSLRFILDQTDELELFTHIRLILTDVGSIWIRKVTNDKCHYRYEVSSLDVLNLLVDYSNRNPLRTKKNVTFVRWKKLLNFLFLVKKEKQEGNYVFNEKREKKMFGLVNEIKNSEKETHLIKQAITLFELQVEERVHL